MFIIGGNYGVCPKGYICLNNYNVLLVLAIIIGVIYFINKQNYLNMYNTMLQTEFQKGNSLVVSNPPAIEIHPITTHDGYSYNNLRHGAVIEQPFNNSSRAMNNNLNNLDIENNANNRSKTSKIPNVDRMLINDPLYPPLSRNYHEDSTGAVEPRRLGVPINIETRGSGGDFQQIGILSKKFINSDAETPGNNTDSNILPLYGKPTYRGSSKWLYYTETDKYNPVKIPINVNNKDCTDDQGCEELYDGNEVVIPSYNGKFVVKIYKFNKPRYIPLDNPREILPLPFT